MKRALLKWGRRAVFALSLSGVLGLLIFFALPWLVIGRADAPPSDVILHFALDAQLNGDAYAAELLRQGKAQHIVCLSSQSSWEVYPADYARQHLLELGVPPAQVSTLHLPANLECRAQVMPIIAEYVKQHGWRRALMVVEPTVSAANRRLATPVFARAGIQLGLTYAPRDYEVLTTNWWREHWKTQRLTGEALNTGFDFFYTECW
ncbi:MAG: hypothetical protein HYR56_16430 [Acidobacteria bacterium]|nr:hypothetical protein [Acidobacteriota bacterium]MBI3421403.1 hypothetical protein [Acidobacteriota bacterium]